ncbi:MAG: hypothetical protein M3401_16120 [Actinomycetota bacterium]|nr:hypothetical protein [Actinomycetota bacterium]
MTYRPGAGKWPPQADAGGIAELRIVAVVAAVLLLVAAIMLTERPSWASTAVPIAAPARAAYDSDGVFVLARPFRFPQDVAMLPDGSVLVSNGQSSADLPTWRLWPDGRRVRVAGFDASGFAVAPDGSVLGIDGSAHPDGQVVRRWVPGGQPSIIAGGAGLNGSTGDSGPALAATLSLDFSDSHGIVPLPDGGFLFAETGKQRVRAVDPAGVIRTIVRSLDVPRGLAATRDGRFIVSDQDALREFGLDGRMKTSHNVRSTESPPADVESLPDGSVLWTNTSGELQRLTAEGRDPVQMMRSGPTRQWDFAGRSVDARGIAQTADGGLLITGGGGVVYKPNGPTAWALVALRNTRIGRTSLDAVIETTRPGVVTLELLRGRRVIARDRKSVGRGHATLRIARRPSARFHTLRATLRAPGAAKAHDQVKIFTARELTVRQAKSVIGGVQNDDPVQTIYRSDRCRAFGPRRVDCEIRDESEQDAKVTDVCDSMRSLTLRRSGIILNRSYRCGDQRHGVFREHPAWDAGVDGADTPDF